MKHKLTFLVVNLIIGLVISILLYVTANSLHKNSYFYCYLFDKTRFYAPKTIDNIAKLYDKLNLKQDNPLIFDYIIIGAGTAGSIIANRLSEFNQNSSILVLEAGKNMNGNVFKEIPGIAPFTWSNSYGDFIWDYLTIQQQHIFNRTFKWPAGKLVGGSSSNNFMIYSHVFPSDYEKWSQVSGCDNWNWNSVEEFFYKIQETSVADKKLTELGKVWQKMWSYRNDTFNEKQMKMFIKNGLRWDMSKEHLYLASQRQNISILLNTIVKKIIFDNTSNAIAVELDESKNIFVRKSIILSAGTIQNVRIMKNSLKNHNHPLYEQIGRSLKDHFFTPLFFEISNSDIYGYSTSILSMLKYFWNYLFFSKDLFAQTMLDGGQVYLDTNMNNNSEWSMFQFSPNIQFLLVSSLIDSLSLESIFSKYLDSISLKMFNKIISKIKSNTGFVIFVILTKPLSEGKINYNSSRLEINPNYLSKSEDLLTILKAIKYLNETIEMCDEIKALNIKLIKPSNIDSEYIQECNDKDTSIFQDTHILDYFNNTNFNTKYWICYIKQLAYSIFHYHGTMKFSNTSTSVLDCNLRFQNLSNLYVVDASVIPYPVSGGFQSATMMIAEKFMKETKWT